MSRPLENTVALVRGYAPVPRKSKRAIKSVASKFTLIFDTETTVDAAQGLRFGFYEFWKRGELIEKGTFYEGKNLVPEEYETLRKYAEEHEFRFLDRSEFVDDVFYGMAYELGATIVGFNLPFDISRLAINSSPARRKMKGGFTFQLSENKYRARVQIKHLNGRAALIQFAAPRRQRTPRGQRKRGLRVPVRRGAFLDVNTLAAALLGGRSFSLGGLADHLKTEHRKQATEEHGQVLTSRYVHYAAMDVRVTKECLDKLLILFDDHGLKKTSADQVLSEASLGKGYLREMGVRPFLELQSDFSNHFLGQIMSAYYGGRTEVRWRRTVKRVLYCDFLSMYPTVFSLMALWPFVTAKGLHVHDTTDATQAVIDSVTLDGLQDRAFWPQLHTIVRLRPNDDVLPIRAAYGKESATIGLNEITSDSPLWYTLADVIASKLQTGRAPRIEQALTFSLGRLRRACVP